MAENPRERQDRTRSASARPMPIVKLSDIPHEPFKGGATYQTIVGDRQGSTPIRVGVQTSPPGYKTALHSHPYVETVTVLEGQGEAWLDDGSNVVPSKCSNLMFLGTRKLASLSNPRECIAQPTIEWSCSKRPRDVECKGSLAEVS
ncbi:MAG: hypothetical protein ACKVP3_02335 [Hyphomicrobiaceae bacterium]